MTDKNEQPQPAQAGKDSGPAEATAHAMQKATDEAEEKGYLGEAADETPRENYTVAGVVAGKPTPERTELEKA